MALTDLLDPDVENWVPGWRPVLRDLRAVRGDLDGARLGWDRGAGRLEVGGWPREWSRTVELASEVLLATCDQCGALNGLGRPVVVDEDGHYGVRCGAHDPRAPALDGVWDALEQSEWVMTRAGEIVRVAELTDVQRADICTWLREEALRHAREARERALVEAHRRGDDAALRAAIDIPAHDIGLARAQVVTSPLFAALDRSPSREVVVDLPDEVVAFIDGLVAAGKYDSRDHYVRVAMERCVAHLEDTRRHHAGTEEAQP